MRQWNDPVRLGLPGRAGAPIGAGGEASQHLLHDPVHDPEDAARCARALRLIAPRRSMLRRVVGSILAMLLVTAVLLMGGAAWRLGRGPISAPFLTERVLREIGTHLPPGYGVDLARVALAKDAGGLALVFDDLTLRDAAGRALAAAPRVRIGLGVWPLLAGRVEPQSVQVDGAATLLRVAPDGRVALLTMAEGDVQAPTPPSSVTGLLGTFDTLLAGFGTLQAVDLHDAVLAVDDQAFHRQRRYGGLDASVSRSPDGKGLRLAVDGGGRGRLFAEVRGRPDGGRAVTVDGDDVDLGRIAAAFTRDANVPIQGAMLDGHAEAGFAADGRVEAARLTLSAGPGTWRPAPDVPAFPFDGAALKAHWDGAAVVLDEASLRSGPGHARFQGRAVPPDRDGGTWAVALDGPGTTLAGEDAVAPPLVLTTARLRGRFDPAIQRFGIDDGVIGTEVGGLVFKGSVGLAPGSPGYGFGIEGSRMPVWAMKRLWPFFAAPPAREWFMANALDGTVESLKVSVAIAPGLLVPVGNVVPPLPGPAMTGSLRFSGSRLRAVDTLPPLQDVSADVAFTARSVHVAVDHAGLDTGEGDVLTSEDATYEVGDLGSKPAHQHIQFSVGGPARGVARLMTMPPLSTVSTGVALQPSAVTGTAALTVDMALPLLDHPALDDVRYTVAGTLNGLGIQGFRGTKLEHGALKLAITPGLISLGGTATLAGLPATIGFVKDGEAEPKVTLAATLDPATLAQHGVNLGDGLTGPVAVKVDASQAGGASPRYGVEIDLANARVRDLLPGWDKPPGRPGKASFTYVPRGTGADLQDIALDSGPVSLRGDATLGPGGSVRRVALSSLRLGPDDDAQASLEATATGYRATVRARSLDLRPLLQMAQKHGTGGGTPPSIDADVSIGQAIGFGDEAISDLVASVHTRQDFVAGLQARGRLGAGTLQASVGGEDGRIRLTVGDAGALLRLIDTYTHMQGGTLQGSFAPRLDASTGVVEVRNFQVRNEPALGQYLDSAGRSPAMARDPTQGALPKATDAVRFSHLRLDFSRTASRLAIKEGVVWGPDVGANLSGEVDYAADRVDLTGTFVPAYALNNIFSKIPVLGVLLGGGSDEGLFAVTFKVAGPVTGPTLTINPLSAIAPGILRKIFEFRKDDAGSGQ